MATNVAAIPALANRPADALYSHMAASAVEAVDLLCPPAWSGGGIRIARQSLPPLDLGRFETADSAIPPLIHDAAGNAARTSRTGVSVCTALRSGDMRV